MIDTIANRHVLKKLMLAPNGRLYLACNLPNIWIGDFHRIVAPLVLSVRYPGWPLIDPERTAMANAENAEFERMVRARVGNEAYEAFKLSNAPTESVTAPKNQHARITAGTSRKDAAAHPSGAS